MELYAIGYKCNDAYTTYLSLGSPKQLTKQQVAHIKAQNDGSPKEKKRIKIGKSGVFTKQVKVRENDVMLILLKKVS